MATYDITIRVEGDDPRDINILTDMITDPGAQVGYSAQEWGITILSATVTEAQE